MILPGQLLNIFAATRLLLLAAALLSFGCVKHYRYAPSTPVVPSTQSAMRSESQLAPHPATAAAAAALPAEKPAPAGQKAGAAGQIAAANADRKPTPPARPEPSATAAPKQGTAADVDHRPLESMGFSIQVGAFANLDNAVRLERLLATRGVDAYYFRHQSGLYKVRFGNHDSHAKARREAEKLRKQGVIAVFYIVRPEEYAAARVRAGDAGDLRSELVRTAQRFLGVPYRWGGTDDEAGFDCSGLTMVCYRLNGLNLPRESRYQFRAGRLIPKEELRPGDLVFFATRGGKRVSHVGIFIGNGKFIHAPRTGQDVRVDALADPFYTKTFMGGRSYF